jgi:hypothetical protein
VPIRCYVQGCAWCFSCRRRTPNSAGTMVGEVCSSLSLAGTHFLTPQLSVSDHHEDVSVGIHRNCFQVAVPQRPSRSYGLHGIHVVIHMQLRHADGAYRRGVSQ